MRFERSLQHLLLAFMVAFGVVVGSAAYWGVLGADQALSSPFNYRVRAEAETVRRGDVLDRDGRALVESLPREEGRWQRLTRDASLPSITGYLSFTYGAGGAEAAYDALLTGAETSTPLARMVDRDLLHRPQRGQDIRLTLHLPTQQAAYAALDGRRGAVVVMDADTGALLAVVSTPSITPETLDADWEQLTQRDDDPFFNRALVGEYQPGSALQPLLLAGWLIAGHTETAALDADLSAPVRLGELALSCALPPPTTPTPTLLEAFLSACPAGFAAALDALGEQATRQTLDLFGATGHIFLEGFTPPPSSADAGLAEPSSTDWRADALGQGALRLSPLDMAVMLAGLANDGNAPQPYLLDAIRPTPEAAWQAVPSPQQTQAVTTAQTAQQVKAAMRQLLAGLGIAGADGMGGHIGQAQAGQQALTWFTGYAQSAPDREVVVVVLWEAEATPQAIATAGVEVLRAAQQAITPAP
jgi:peptidoglycan glycosyltransferase